MTWPHTITSHRESSLSSIIFSTGYFYASVAFLLRNLALCWVTRSLAEVQRHWPTQAIIHTAFILTHLTLLGLSSLSITVCGMLLLPLQLLISSEH
ncbi:hypothetical protein J3E69DRAFT_348929 [Trichoderma sp. SZMC 28015]